MKGSIEAYDTPFISNGVGFNVYRGTAYFDELVVSAELFNPDIKIDPVEMEYDFGNVEVGNPSLMYLTVQNVGDSNLIIENVGMNYFIVNEPFTYKLPSELPITIAPEAEIEIEVSYVPTFLHLTQSNDLLIVSNDQDESLVEVTFYGHGVLAEEHSAAVAGIQYFIDQSVEQGSLFSEGKGKSAEKRINALKNMIESAGDLIEDDDIQGACDQLLSIYKKIDGLPIPPDFISGPATAGVAAGLNEIMIELGCE